MTGPQIVVQVDAELADMIPAFLANRAAEVPRLAEAVERADMETLAHIGHALKGAGGSYGFPAVSELGDRIECAALARDADAARAAVAQLADYLERVHVVPA